ncbi:MAG: multiprotein bridging factor aMBF1 [Candidatus Aramenus sulfurataquae]|jgi:putative transcription factor|uniref:Multiprotein bridging factor aMBF1 n=2 Tax=Candidatus Aramenus sulfurataquae TaxID=1326980 RepID=A0A0F2LQB1_9CREN|nr:multiprotein bridging factor aMBF1 [Candidatus Aramenus sulfurataquae]
MQKEVQNYCELCGSPIKGKGITVSYEGSIINVCNSCYAKIKGHSKIVDPKKVIYTSSKQQLPKHQKAQPKLESKEDVWEIIDEYPKLIRQARERLGMTTKDLAQKLKVQENVIKRFELGRLKPTIQQARELERVLSIKLLVKVEEKGEEGGANKTKYELTLGDVVNIREGNE